MQRIPPAPLACALIGVALNGFGPAQSLAEESAISYTTQIRPILSDKCFACHGPDPNSREAGLRLDTLEGATLDLGDYAAIVPGDPGASEAMVRMLATDDSIMPPAESHKSLTPEEIELLRAWIAQGAQYEEHWSYRPLQRPAVPSGKGTHPIDAFLNEQLEKEHLKPADRADRATLVRRLHFDLLGLPPTAKAAHEQDCEIDQAAWESMVDRLLDNPRYGERMAVYWLDLVRYADTIGYHSDNHMEVSPYREYVIRAFNENRPFDAFTTEQLAGDLLPNATPEQIIASGYNRLLQTTEEGGAQPKEYEAIYAADRVRNYSNVWLGSTMNCAQCHDHKYDPITARDFYTMAAFFADIAEEPIGPRDFGLHVPTPEQQKQLAAFDRKLRKLDLKQVLDRNPELREETEQAQRRWEAAERESLANSKALWDCPPATEYTSDRLLKLSPLPDNSLYAWNATPYDVTYQVRLPARGTVRSIRLDTFTHPSFRGENRFSNNHRDFVLTEFVLEVDGKLVKMSSAEADFTQRGFPAKHLIDGNHKTGWAVGGHPKQDRISVVLRLATPLELGEEGKEVSVRLVHRSIFPQHHVGRFRVSFSPKADAPLDSPQPLPRQVTEALVLAEADRTPEQQQHLTDYYHTISPELTATRAKRDGTTKKKLAFEDQLLKSLVSVSLSEPRTVRILARGNWQDESGEVVMPATPEFLPSDLPADRRLTRLDLAEWTLDRDNPLTARVFVNRLWKLFYGYGLSRDVGDLGGQGSPPSHARLLDWLAAEFIESGWDVKHMVRLMVTSEAYQRSSLPSEQQLALDPTNRWLASQNRWRLEAEFVRDAALSVSGLLDVNRLGGISVKPYQPEGYWQHLNFPPREWQASQGADLYRRSVYTYWCRTFLHPSMMAFDAPSREECTAERPRSNIPQQVLALMNDPIYVEAARVFAARIASQDGDVRTKATWAIEQVYARAAEPEEVDRVAAFFDKQRAEFAVAPDRAQELVSVGSAAAAEGIDPVDQASWTQVARALLSTYESIARL